jgi:replicative DNA helicase
MSQELQKAIIGAVILQPDVLLSVTDEITPEDMDHRNGIILSHVLRLYADGIPIDLGSLSQSLQESKEIEQAGGITYLVECTDIPTTANAVHHAQLVKKQSMRARIKSWGSTVAGREFTGEIQETLGTLEQEILEIADRVKPKKSPEIRDILSAIECRQAKIDHANRNGEDTGLWISTKFWGDSIPAYHSGHFWTITGYTSYGKSLLLSTMLVDVMKNNGKVLVFSLEDSREEKVMGLKGVLADVPKSWQIQGDIGRYRDVLLDADSRLLRWEPIIYDDVRTLDDMRLKVKKHAMRDGINVVAIDYIQQIKEPGTLYERMSHAAIYLQEMFKELDVTGIVLSQIDNVSARDGGQLIGAKGGGDIPAASDIVIQIDRHKDDKKRVNLVVKKNRVFGKTGSRPCKFSERWTSIEYDFIAGT